jgi:hypothetical protein
MRSEMSSTLFNRGMTTQMGQRRRAEEIQRSINELRATASDTRALHEENMALRTAVSTLEMRLASLEKGGVTAAATVSTPSVAPEAVTALQETVAALTRRVDDTILSLQGRLTAVEAGSVRITDRFQALETNTTVADAVASLRTQVEAINSNTTVTDTLRSLRTQIDAMASNATVNDAVSSLRTQIASLETRLAGLEPKTTENTPA